MGPPGSPPPRELSGAKGNRTPDPFHAMEVLYQLSYSPIGVGELLAAAGACAPMPTGLTAEDEVDQPSGHDDDPADRRAVQQRGHLRVGSGRGLQRRRVERPARTWMRARPCRSPGPGPRRCRRPASAGSASGNALPGQRSSWPRRDHSSSAMCGASGASSSTSGSATSRRHAAVVVLRGQVVVQLGDAGDRGVEPQRLHAVADRRDRAVQDAAGRRRRPARR